MSLVHFGNAFRGGPRCPTCKRYCIEHACPTCSRYDCTEHTPAVVLAKVERELRGSPAADLPEGWPGFSFWLLRHLDADELKILLSLEAEVGRGRGEPPHVCRDDRQREVQGHRRRDGGARTMMSATRARLFEVLPPLLQATPDAVLARLKPDRFGQVEVMGRAGGQRFTVCGTLRACNVAPGTVLLLNGQRIADAPADDWCWVRWTGQVLEAAEEPAWWRAHALDWPAEADAALEASNAKLREAVRTMTCPTCAARLLEKPEKDPRDDATTFYCEGHRHRPFIVAVPPRLLHELRGEAGP